jgi:hypothetical protein
MFNDPHLKLSIVGSEEGVQRSILHELGDDHDWVGLGYDTLKKNPTEMINSDQNQCFISTKTGPVY